MHAAEIVVHEVQCHRRFQVFQHGFKTLPGLATAVGDASQVRTAAATGYNRGNFQPQSRVSYA
jgi:hypothetical protein